MATMDSGRSSASDTSSQILKIIGVVLLLIPAALIAVIAVSDMVGGDLMSVLELLFAVPLLILAWLGWRRPRLSGLIIVAGSVVLAAVWCVWSTGRFDDWTLHLGYFIQGVLMLFAPPLVAGVLFLLAARTEHSPRETT